PRARSPVECRRHRSTSNPSTANSKCAQKKSCGWGDPQLASREVRLSGAGSGRCRFKSGGEEGRGGTFFGEYPRQKNSATLPATEPSSASEFRDTPSCRD